MRNILIIGLTSPLEGGAERHIYEVSSRIENCTVLAQNGSICKKKIELPLIPRPVFLRNVSFLITSAIYAVFLLVTFRKKYDIIHIHPNLLYFLAPLLRLRYKVIITVHGIKGFKFYDNKFIWFFFRTALGFANAIVAVNLKDKKELEKIFNRAEYIPNGVDLSTYSKINLKVEKKISFIGRIHEQKGIIYLLESFDIINKEFPDFKLEIIGGMTEYAYELQKKFRNKNVAWRGSITDRKEIIRSLKSAYCIVLPSLWEGLPLTLFESLASGRPVVLSDISAFKSVVKDEALFFRNKDFKDMARKIKTLIVSKKLADRYGAKGIKLAKSYDWSKIADRLQSAYNRI